MSEGERASASPEPLLGDVSSAAVPARGLLFVMSGPSGSGKDEVARILREDGVQFAWIVTAVTRPPRPDERHGVHHLFVPPHQFEQMVARGELLEWTEVYGRWYGTPRYQVERALTAGQDVLLRVDVQGAAKVKAAMPDAILIFIAPPSLDELVRRRRARGTETEAQAAIRTQLAPWEMEQRWGFDYLVVNYHNRQRAAAGVVEAIITAERCRIRRPAPPPG
jgi:guanylate kinase